MRGSLRRRLVALGSTAVMVATLGTVAIPAGAASSDSTVRASIGWAAPTEANDESTNPSISWDGRFVAFQSEANNLIAADTNDRTDIFLRDHGPETPVDTLFSSFDVPAIDSDGVQTPPLLPGHGYRIKVTGTYRYGNMDPGFVADAECSTDHTESIWRHDRFAASTPDPNDDPLDLYINDGVANDILDGPVTWQLPEEAPVEECATDTDHTYEYTFIAQAGGPVTFKVYDFQNYWLDNSGALHVTIYKIETLPATTAIASAVHLTDVPGNGASYTPSISADGRVVAFASDATNLPGPAAGPGVSDTNNMTDIYVRYTDSKQIERVSVGWGGLQPNGPAYRPAVSGDGSRIAFDSTATNIRSDLNPPPVVPKVWMRNINDNWSWLVATCADNAAVSLTAEFVAYLDCSGNVIRKDTWGIGSTATVSIGLSGLPANGLSNLSRPAISGDGRYVAFVSAASNLVSGDTNGVADVFVRDMQAGTTTRVSVATDGTQGNGLSDQPAISSDGRFISFRSAATNLASGDDNGAADVFVRDTVDNVIRRISVDSSDEEANGASSSPTVASEGSAAFASAATDLVAGDTNLANDVFVRKPATPTGFNICHETGEDNQIPDRTDVPYYCETAYRDISELPEGEVIEPLLEQAFGDRYAGKWIDRLAIPKSVRRVGIVNATPADEATLDQLSGMADRHAVVSMKYSKTILDQYKEIIIPIVDARAAEWAISIVVPENIVKIRVDVIHPELMSDILAANIPSDAFVILPGWLPPNYMHSQRKEYPPYEGGLWVQMIAPVESMGPCTTWFTTVNSSGTYKGITAGHCEPHSSKAAIDNAYVYMNEPEVTVSEAGSNSTYNSDAQPVDTQSDAVRFSISGPRARIYKSSGNHRTVRSPRFYPSGLEPGYDLCFQGITSGGGNCAEIHKDFDHVTLKNPHRKQSSHLWCIKYPGQPGDSGGPVFYPRQSDGSAKAAGIHSMRITWEGKTLTCFHGVGYVLQDMGVDLVYG